MAMKIGFTNGCFDVLHVGHVRLLGFARDHCDRLIVGLNSDASVRALKGPGRPINCQEDRYLMLLALKDGPILRAVGACRLGYVVSALYYSAKPLATHV
jgi:cytidyltransferase-like protein